MVYHAAGLGTAKPLRQVSRDFFSPKSGDELADRRPASALRADPNARQRATRSRRILYS
jgi:hypothetical protein